MLFIVHYNGRIVVFVIGFFLGFYLSKGES